MSKTRNGHGLSVRDRARIGWAVFRYDFWLDLKSVPGKHRKVLRRELRANLGDAAAAVGASAALANVGDMRGLAAETTRDGQLRSRWLVGSLAAVTTFAVLNIGFWLVSMYYTEGVLDAGATEPVSSWLWPFFGSTVTVDPSGTGLAWQLSPGPLPFAAAAVALLLIARPWRGLRSRRVATVKAHAC